MIYALTVTRHIKGGRDFSDRNHFAHYSNAYAFMSRRTRDLLESSPASSIDMVTENRDFNHGTYSRTIILKDADGRKAATLYLEGVYFDDGLVEEFPDQYADEDFPQSADNK